MTKHKASTKYSEAQAHIHSNTRIGKPEKQLKTYATVYEERKTNLLNKIILEPPESPIRHTTFEYDTLTPISITERRNVIQRSGQPRVKWTETGLRKLWNLVIKHTNPELRYEIMNTNRTTREEAIIGAAKRNLHCDTPNHIIRT